MSAVASAVAASALGVFAPSAVLAASTAAAELLPPPPPPAWGTDVYWGTGITVNAPVYCPEGGCPPASPPPLTPWGEPQPTPEEAAGRWSFFGLLCLCGLVQTVLCPISLYVAWSRISFARLLRLRREEGGEEKYRAARSEQGLNNWSYPPVAVLVPCYLPNERQIIVETIEQIVHNLKYPADVRVCLVYNTPNDMPADEQALVALQNRKWPAGRSVVVYKAQTSRSKAENLNLAIRNLVQEELVAIYDADHWPDAYALMLLVEKLLDTNSDAVQGSVYIRDVEHKSCRQSTIARCAPRVPAAPYRATHHHPACSPPAIARRRYISAEFFCQFFVYFPMLECLSSSGFFGGSNAVWRTKGLRDFEFSTKMQTEDIDVSARAILSNRRIAFCPEARSGELSPADFMTLYRQRLRWLIGWDQVTLSTMKQLWRAQFSIRKCFTVYILFPLRWFTLFVSFSMGIFTPILGGVYTITHWGIGIHGMLYYAVGTYWLSVMAATVAATQYEEIVGVTWVLIFYLTGPLYVLWTLLLVVVSLIKIVTGSVGKWHVTRRASTSPKATAASQVEQPPPVSLPVAISPGGTGRRRTSSGALRLTPEPSEEDLMSPLRSIGRIPSAQRMAASLSDSIARVPSWIAMNPFGTHRFNQLEEDLDYSSVLGVTRASDAEGGSPLVPGDSRRSTV